MAHLFIRVASRKQSSIALLYLHWFSASTAIRVVTSGNVTIQSGARATLSCEMDKQGTVEQVEWSRCEQHRVLVYHSRHGLNVAPLYQGRITDVTLSGFTIGNTIANDTGDYCCTLTAFPHGTIKNRLHLLIRPPDDQPIFTTTVPIIIGVLCTALLVGVIFVTFHRGRRRPVQNPVHVVIRSDHSFYKKTVASPSSSPKASPSQSSHNGQEDGNHSDGDDYFNVTSK